VRRALLARSDAFVTALTQQLFTYAVGRIGQRGERCER
jgi:hypothetical protein